jgi:hypothetical protein
VSWQIKASNIKNLLKFLIKPLVSGLPRASVGTTLLETFYLSNSLINLDFHKPLTKTLSSDVIIESK